mmetsp:Transcript_60609/g.179687  ORF Transcript_60609/g.179687 Transcript_60609/m.179687 type:complete len:140 (-) Transcript_60609:773-1192(-)
MNAHRSPLPCKMLWASVPLLFAFLCERSCVSGGRSTLVASAFVLTPPTPLGLRPDTHLFATKKKKKKKKDPKTPASPTPDGHKKGIAAKKTREVDEVTQAAAQIAKGIDNNEDADMAALEGLFDFGAGGDDPLGGMDFS